MANGVSVPLWLLHWVTMSATAMGGVVVQGAVAPVASLVAQHGVNISNENVVAAVDGHQWYCWLPDMV